jgi:hypothetical protein
VDERAAVERDEERSEVGITRVARRGERAKKPGQAGQCQQRTCPALGTPEPGEDAAADENEAHHEIRDREAHFASRRGRLERPSPERRPFGVEAERDPDGEDGQPQSAH